MFCCNFKFTVNNNCLYFVLYMFSSMLNVHTVTDIYFSYIKIYSSKVNCDFFLFESKVFFFFNFNADLIGKN